MLNACQDARHRGDAPRKTVGNFRKVRENVDVANPGFITTTSCRRVVPNVRPPRVIHAVWDQRTVFKNA